MERAAADEGQLRGHPPPAGRHGQRADRLEARDDRHRQQHHEREVRPRRTQPERLRLLPVEEQRQLEMMAQHRAGVLSAGLPIEYGPLSVMRVLAKNTVIEIMMIYNQDAKGAKPLNQVVDMSVNSYCTNSEVRANLDMGLAYNIKIRNTRGQLMVEKLISKETCQSSS